eukprot:Trichotokara_eunicae@DN5732_c0_g1_i1.p2
MALFCPTCHNLLLISEQYGCQFYCQTCPYLLRLNETVVRKSVYPTKKIDAAVDVDNALADAPKSQTVCPKCNFNEAYVHEMQTRSADEPMTCFYRCCKCTFRWKEG